MKYYGIYLCAGVFMFKETYRVNLRLNISRYKTHDKNIFRSRVSFELFTNSDIQKRYGALFNIE
jgi:hypothetical protein